MPRRLWTNRQTEVIASWIRQRPELISVLRRTAEEGDGDKLREHVNTYFFPVNTSRDVYCELVHIAIDQADWEQIRSSILPADGESP